MLMIYLKLVGNKIGAIGGFVLRDQPFQDEGKELMFNSTRELIMDPCVFCSWLKDIFDVLWNENFKVVTNMIYHLCFVVFVDGLSFRSFSQFIIMFLIYLYEK
jgi:hypothetical protein